jgi:RHS repeat-associated protein
MRIITQNTQTTSHTYLSGPEGLFAVVVKEQKDRFMIHYIHTDHLGSWNTITDAGGNKLQEINFDAWGNRRDPNTWRAFASTPAEPLFDRGFTGHEHLYGFGLINMNGRMYDPVVSRMLSPDNFVQAPDFSQSFNRYSYCFNNPLVYTDPDGEWVHIVVGAVVGGVINLATNWNNCDGFWEYAAAFGAGAGSGALTAAFGPLGALGGGALVGGTNNLISQTGTNFSGSVNWGQVGINTVVGGVAGIGGYGAGQWASNNLGGVVINGFKINSQSVWAHTINGAFGGAFGGYAGGFTGGLLMTGDISMAHQTGMQGMKFGAGIGVGTGFAGGLYSGKQNGLNPWSGKPKNSVTIGEGMSTDPTKGWMGIDKIADDLGSDYYKPDSDIQMNGPIKGSTTSNGMYNNAIWIENNVKGTGAYIYDRGPVGNNSQYYNMEVGRTMNYPIIKVTPYYNRSQTIRVLILRK